MSDSTYKFQCPRCGGFEGYIQQKQFLKNNNLPGLEEDSLLGLTFRDYASKTPTALTENVMICKNCPLEVVMFNKTLRDLEEKEKEKKKKAEEKLKRDSLVTREEKARRREENLQNQLKKKAKDPSFKVDPNLIKAVQADQTSTGATTLGCLMLVGLMAGVVLLIVKILH
ncbi:MAG: hypothetical protein RLZZ251_224 [Actinomycetota bacterium]|jgi:uncharacterized surface anchored protein